MASGGIDLAAGSRLQMTEAEGTGGRADAAEEVREVCTKQVRQRCNLCGYDVGVACFCSPSHYRWSERKLTTVMVIRKSVYNVWNGYEDKIVPYPGQTPPWTDIKAFAETQGWGDEDYLVVDERTHWDVVPR